MLQQLYDFYKSPDYAHYAQLANLEQIMLDAKAKLNPADVEKYNKDYAEVYTFTKVKLPEAQAAYKLWQDKQQALKVELEELEGKIVDTNKLLSFYKEALEKLTNQYLGSLSSMLTEVYQSVYQSDEKRVFLGMEDFRGKKVIRLYMVNHQDGHDYPEPFENDGGSAMQVLGIIVGIYFILTTGAPKVMFIDESLSALHDDVLHRFLEVLQKFSQELDFKFVIVDHSALRMRGYINKIYHVQKGVYSEVTDLESFYAKIERGEV